MVKHSSLFYVPEWPLSWAVLKETEVLKNYEKTTAIGTLGSLKCSLSEFKNKLACFKNELHSKPSTRQVITAPTSLDVSKN